MTHVYAYVKEGFNESQISNLIGGLKKAVNESFNLCDDASTVVVKEMASDCCSDNLGVFALVYTAKGKGFDNKKLFAKMFHAACNEALGEINVKMVMKEQAADMVGINGVLRCHNHESLSSYEMN